MEPLFFESDRGRHPIDLSSAVKIKTVKILLALSILHTLHSAHTQIYVPRSAELWNQISSIQSLNKMSSNLVTATIGPVPFWNRTRRTGHLSDKVLAEILLYLMSTNHSIFGSIPPPTLVRLRHLLVY